MAVVLLAALGSMALAQVETPGENLVAGSVAAIDWWTVDGGGGTASGGGYTVSGTVGQPEAGGVSSGGIYGVTGGFWGVGVAWDEVYLPYFGR